MLPFGNTPFGQGFWGRGDWGRRVFWENVPGEHQLKDAEYGGYLEKLLNTWGAEYDALLQQVLTVPAQRDPFQARGREDCGETMYVTQVVAEADATYGATIKLYEEANPSAFPTGVTPIAQVGATWVAEVEDGRWPVVLVRTRNIDSATAEPLYDPATSIGNEVWCSTGDLLPFAYADEVVGTGDGTASPAVAVGRPVRFAANPSAAVATAAVVVEFTGSITGAVTCYDDGAGELHDDDGFGQALGALRGTVDYDAGTIALDVGGGVPGEVVVAATDVTATYTVRGYYVRLRPQSMLERLHRDFGLVADTGAPDVVQIAALAHFPHYMARKGTAESFRVLGSIYLWDVTATALWQVCDLSQVVDYPSGHVWTVGGRIFTDIVPRRVRFDDIAADAEYYDRVGDHNGGVPGLVPVLDREVIFDDDTTMPTGDGWSVAKGYAVDVTQGYYYPARTPAQVVSATALSAADLALYGLAAGFRIVVSLTADQKAEFNYTGRGKFALTAYDKTGLVPPSWTADPYWIDAEESWNPGTLEWTVVVGATSVPTQWTGAGVKDVAVRYWPEIDLSDCCYCRTAWVRVRVLPTAEGEAHYGDSLVVGSPLYDARKRLQARIEELILPSHVRVAEYVYV